MSNFIPRTTQPSNTDKRWININHNGYNRCIEGYPQPVQYSVLANCTGYVHGRWMEIMNLYADNVGLPYGNATTYWTMADSNIIRTQQVELGAIACWDGTINGGLGHVAVIEDIRDILGIKYVSYSESNYGGDIFKYVQLKPLQTLLDEQGFQGFLVHPNIHPTGDSKFKWWMARLLMERRNKKL